MSSFGPESVGRAALVRLRAWLTKWHPVPAQSNLDEELQFHIHRSVEQYEAAGRTPTEARRLAMLDFGGVERHREEAWRQRPSWLIETCLQDARYALRGFLRNPAFIVTVLLTLALGIGATTAVFSVVDRILFRNLPYAHDERLVSVGLSQSLEKQEFTLGGFFYEWQQNQTSYSSVTFERGTGACNLTETNPVALTCAQVAQNFLPTFGVPPVLGRNFTPQEDLPNGPGAVLLTDSLWQSRYNRNKAVLNRVLMLDGRPVTVVGILPSSFQMPRLQPADLVLPAQMDVAAQHTVNAGIGVPVWAFARLKPNISIEQARLQMTPLFLHTQQWIPAQIRNDFHLEVRSLRDRQMQSAYASAWVLFAAALAMMLIACANVAGLFLARGAARERELAVRAALGATRARIVRQGLTEATLLASASAILGMGMAAGLLRLFLALAPTGVPFLAEARLDPRIATFTVLLSLVCVLFCGAVTATQKPRASTLAARAGGFAAPARLRSLLVTLQIAISLLLLSGASLLFKSFGNLERQALGLDAGHALTVEIPLNAQRYLNGQPPLMNFYLRVEAALRSIPGIKAVALSDSLPPSADAWHNGLRFADILLPGQAAPAAASPGDDVLTRSVTPDYFRALHIPIVEGRGFTEPERSSTEHPVVLSRLLALRLFAHQNPLGRRLRIAEYRPSLVLDGPPCTVVGVAENVKNAGLAGQDDPEFYTLRSNRADLWGLHTILIVDIELPPSTVVPWIKARIAEIDPTVPVKIARLDQQIRQLADRPRFETSLFAFFALCGLLMAIIGLYGLIAYLAAQRTQEIGIRLALGASRLNILALVAGQGMRLVVAGSLLGIAAALGFSHLLASRLFHVSARDPLTLAAVTALLTVAALLATLLPASSALRTDPAEALRRE